MANLTGDAIANLRSKLTIVKANLSGKYNSYNGKPEWPTIGRYLQRYEIEIFAIL